MINISTVDIVLFFSATLVSCAYLCTDILLLRLLVICGMTGYLVGIFMIGFDVQGIIVVTFFNFLNLTVNIVQSIRVVLARRRVVLPRELQGIYYRNFDKMQHSEFLKVYKLAEQKSALKDELLIRQDMQVEEVILITNGLVNVIRDKVIIASIGSGFFAGEMSFINEGVANSSVAVSDDKLSYLSWSQDVLDELKRKDKNLYEKFNRALAVNLILKVDKHVQNA